MKQPGQVVQAGGGGGMAGAERLFADGERPFIQRAGRRVVAHRTKQLGQVVQAGGGGGMAGSERLFINGDSPFIQRAGRRVVAHRFEQPGEVVQAGCGGGMAGSERLFINGDSPFIQRAGRRVVAHRIQVVGQVVAQRGRTLVVASGCAVSGIAKMRGDGLHRAGIAGLVVVIRSADECVFHHSLRLWVIRDITHEGVEQAMQEQRVPLFVVHQSQAHETRHGILDIQSCRLIGQVASECCPQQIGGDGFARCEARGAGEQAAGVGIAGFLDPQAIIAEGEGAGHMEFVICDRLARSTTRQRWMAQ